MFDGVVLLVFFVVVEVAVVAVGCLVAAAPLPASNCILGAQANIVKARKEKPPYKNLVGKTLIIF